MDSSIFSFILLIIIYVVLQSRNKKLMHNHSNPNPNFPPGPWKLPVIGNLHQLASPAPHQALRNLAQKHGPLMHIHLGEVPTIVVSSSEMAKQKMKTHDITFSSRHNIIATKIMYYDYLSIAFSPCGDYWRQLRRICASELLNPSRVQSFRSIREEEVSNLLRSLSSSKGSSINFSEKLFSLSHDITSRAAFGDKAQDKELFRLVLQDAVELAAGFNVADLFPSIKLLHLTSGVQKKLEKLFEKSDEILEKIVTDHKSKRVRRNSRGGNGGDADYNEDLVDVLLNYHEDDAHPNCFSLSNNSIKAVILDIIAAGSDTTSHEADWAMAEMMRNPRTLEKAQAEIRQVCGSKGRIDEEDLQHLKYLKSVIKETLRLHPAAPLLLPRICGKKCEIKGYEIPQGTKVLINAWAINRDPNYWTDPEVFCPKRFIDSSKSYNGNHF